MEDAIAKLHNTTVRGSTLKVKPAHPRLRVGPEQETEDVPAEKRRRTGDHPAELQQVRIVCMHPPQCACFGWTKMTDPSGRESNRQRTFMML